MSDINFDDLPEHLKAGFRKWPMEPGETIEAYVKRITEMGRRYHEEADEIERYVSQRRRERLGIKGR
jgi:hypothetical protein